MKQTGDFEVAGGEKAHGKGLARSQRRAAHTGRTIETCGTVRVSRTTDREGVANLIRDQECDGVRLIGGENPSDAVASMDPDFIWQEGQDLPPPISALDSDSRVPLSVQEMWKQDKRSEQQPFWLSQAKK
jgi:hypothetical protein